MLKAFSITDHQIASVPHAMPPASRQHWLDIRYHFDDPAKTPVANVSYKLSCQANPAFTLEGVTNSNGRIFHDQLIAGHYDLVLFPDPDASAEKACDDAFKSLSLDLANIRLRLQGAATQSTPTTEEAAFAEQFLNQDDIQQLDTEPWLSNINEYDRSMVLLLFLDQSLKAIWRDFLEKTAHQGTALQILHGILTQAVLAENPPEQADPVLSSLMESSANNLRLMIPGLRSRILRRYSRASINQSMELSVIANCASPLALNHVHINGERNLSLFKNDRQRYHAELFTPGHFPLIWQREVSQAYPPVWQHPFTAKLEIHEGEAEFTSPQGQRCQLKLPDIGTFTCNLEDGVFLYRDSRDRWLVKAGQPGILTFLGISDCQLDRITNAQGHYWQCYYENDTNRLHSVISNFNERLDFHYQGQILHQITSVGQNAGQVPLVQYCRDDEQEQPLRYSENKLEAHCPDEKKPGPCYQFSPSLNQLRITDALGAEYIYQYHGCGNLTAFLDPSGGGFNLLYNNEHRLTGFSDAMGNTWQCDYYQSGLVREITFPSGLTYSFQYNSKNLPNRIQINRDLTRELQWSDRGVLLKDSEPPIESGTETIPTLNAIRKKLKLLYGNTCEFDRNGFLSALPMKPGNTKSASMIRFHRDPVGRLLLKETPDGHKTHCQYNRNGQLTEITTRKKTVLFDYDNDGRCLQPEKDPRAKLSALDPMAHQIMPVTNTQSLVVINTPYCHWILDCWEQLFRAFTHDANQDALFTLALWQGLNDRSFLPFCRYD